MSTGAQPASGIARYRILRELGARSQRSYAAIREPHELVVVHRFAKNDSAPVDGVTAVPPEELGLLLRDAQCLAKNWHPNIARVKHVDLANGDLTIASELVEGTTLSDLIALMTANGGTFPLDVLVRILLDVLAGIHGIHGLRDGRNMPIGAIHGELCPTNIIVGRDGVARIVNALRPRPIRVGSGSEAVGYAAPEMLDGGAVDARADVHAVGVILWETLSGKRLHDEKDPARVLARQREIDIPPPVLQAGSPYAALAQIAMRALAFDPALRFRTAAEMASELRKLPGARIATGSMVASRVLALDGERIRRRRAELDPSSSGNRRRVSQEAIAAAQAKVPPKVEQSAQPAVPGTSVGRTPPAPAVALSDAAPSSEPPSSLELEEIPSSAPDTARGSEPALPKRPPVPSAANAAPKPAPPKPAPPRAPTSATNAAKRAAPPDVAPPKQAKPAKPAPSSPAIEERVTVPGSPPVTAAVAVVEERVTVPGSPAIAAPLAVGNPSLVARSFGVGYVDDAERSGAAETRGGLGGRKPPKDVDDAERSGAAEARGGLGGRKPPKNVDDAERSGAAEARGGLGGRKPPKNVDERAAGNLAAAPIPVPPARIELPVTAPIVATEPSPGSNFATEHPSGDGSARISGELPGAQLRALAITSSPVADDPNASESSVGAGVTALGMDDALGDVDARPTPKKRRYLWLSLAAVLLLGGVLIALASRSPADRTANHGGSSPSEITTVTTGALEATTATPATTGASPVATAAGTETSAPARNDEPPGNDEPAPSATTQAGTQAAPTAGPRAEPASAAEAPKPAPRPSNRRYEPLGI